LKPISLEFSAFGPYPDNVFIDFTKLASRGLFLVSGSTGAGKTTIFDAMSYALYGEMPLKEIKQIRSHHATREKSTSVKLTFSAGAQIYAVERTPAQERPKKKGDGLTTQPARASLVEITDNISKPLTSKERETTNACVDIIGFTAEQFRKVMLLPQGDISRFLLDSSVERENLLSQLFSGDEYKNFVERLKEESQVLESRVSEIRNTENRHLDNARTALLEISKFVEPEMIQDFESFNKEDLQEKFELSRGTRLNLEDNTKQLHYEYTEAHERLSNAEQGAIRKERATVFEKEIRELEAKRNQIEADQHDADLSKDARPVVEAVKDLEKKRQEFGFAKEEKYQRLAEIQSSFRNLDLVADVEKMDPVEINDAFNKKCDRIDEFHDVLTKEDEIERLLISIEDDGKKCESLEMEIQELTKQCEILEKNKTDPKDLELKIAQEERAKETSKKRLDLQQQLESQSTQLKSLQKGLQYSLELLIQDQVPKLAEGLIENEPCPVCGSREHPSPAIKAEQQFTLEDYQIEWQKTQDSTNNVGALKDEIAALSQRLGEYALLEPEQIDKKIAETKSAKDQAIADQECLKITKLKKNDLEETHKGHLINRKVSEGNRKNLAEEVSREKPKLSQIFADLSSKKLEELEETVGLIQKDLLPGLNELFSQFDRADNAHQQAISFKDRALEKSNFDTIDNAKQVLLPIDQETGYMEAEEVFRRNLKQYKDQLQVLIEQGLPESKPDLEVFKRDLSTAQDKHSEAQKLTSAMKSQEALFERAIRELDSMLLISRPLFSQAEAARLAYTVCSGQGSKKISFPRWVLARELERILAAASVHLASMSNNRYQICHTTEEVDGRRVAGLELEILDAHTGRSRRPTSLSGGEQFQTSLALALGLADVVALGGTGTGKRLEALFIDEGFGSLDPQALEDAVETLYNLQASGRMIGVITHVQSLKERLHLGIEVKTLDSGKGSTLVVHH
jgi:DNA repair protein SbcC/Rad50